MRKKKIDENENEYFLKISADLPEHYRPGTKKVENKKYRKQPFTQKYSSPPNKCSKDLKHIFQEVPSNSREYKLAQYMIDIADKGADICKIGNALAMIPFRWEKKTGTFNLALDLSMEGKTYFKEEKAIWNAFALLSERLPDVHLSCNSGHSINLAIANMKKQLKDYESLFKKYLDLRLIETCYEKLKQTLPGKPSNDEMRKHLARKLRGAELEEALHRLDDQERQGILAAIKTLYSPDKLRRMVKEKVKPAKQTSQNLFDEFVTVTVDELIRIGYSQEQAYKQTATLLNLRYPAIYEDLNPDRIQSRYTYAKRKK